MMALAGLIARRGIAGLRSLSVTVPQEPMPSDALYDPNRHLFADDDLTERTWDVARVLGKPQDLAEPIIVRDKPWELRENTYILKYFNSVIYDPEYRRYRMWYSPMPLKSSDDNPEFTCLAESQDGVHWSKPSLGVCEFNGSRDNNIVFSNKGTGAPGYRFCVFRDESEKAPDRRYKGFGPCWPYGYFLVMSRDGVHWTPKPRLIQRVGGRYLRNDMGSGEETVYP